MHNMHERAVTLAHHLVREIMVRDQLHDHGWEDVNAAISDATGTIHGALRAGAWTRATAAPTPARPRHPATGRARA